MKNVKEKIIKGEKLLSTEWKQLLLDFHELKPGTTFGLFKDFKNEENLNSYQLISNQLPKETTKPLKILDIGCGNGILSKYCTERISSKSEYVGIDISKAQIELSRKEYSKKNVLFKVEDSENLSFKKEEFDYVICHMTLMLLNPVKKTLQQIGRVLKEEGYFIAVVNSRIVKDDFLKGVMIKTGKYLLSKYPDFSIKNGGDTKTYSKKGLEILLEEIPELSKEVELSEHELTSKMTAQSLYQFLSSSYNVFCLPAAYQEELKELVYKIVAEEQAGKDYFEIKYLVNRYKIKKNA